MYVYKSDEYFNNILKYVKFNLIGILGICAASLVIGFYSGKEYIKALVTIYIVQFVTWLGHYLLHNYNTYNPLAWLHAITHHSPVGETFVGKFVEYVLLEFIFFGGGILLLIVIWIHYLSGIYVLNPYVILFWSISVPFIHEVHYHMFSVSSIHKFHHSNPGFNYSNDYWDIMMTTKEDNSEIEHESLMLPEIFFIAMLVISQIGGKSDFIEYFGKSIPEIALTTWPSE